MYFDHTGGHATGEQAGECNGQGGQSLWANLARANSGSLSPGKVRTLAMQTRGVA
jgi:hypothetical protein